MSAPSATAADGLPEPARSFAFFSVCTSILITVLDSSMINVALPVIAAEQGVGAAEAIQVVTVYQLALVMSLLPFAALGEAVGFRRVYLIGVVLFAAASLLCALADSIAMLSAARLLQGLAAGAIMSLNAALARYILPASRIGRGIGTISLVVGVAAASGPSASAAILSLASWQWLFLINLPFCGLILITGLFSLPHVAGSGHRFDWGSALLNALAFGFLIAGLGGLGRDEVPALVTAAQFTVAAMAIAALARRQIGLAAPMLPLDLLRLPPFALAMVASVCSFAAQFLVFVSLPFYFFEVLGRSAVEIGLLLTPWPVATALVAPFAGRLADRWSAEMLSVLGMMVFALGLLALAQLPPDPQGLDLVWRLALCGIGFGLFQSPNNKVAITSAPRRRSGGASGMQSTARVFGQSLGAALAALLIGRAAGFDLRPMMLTGLLFAIAAIVATLFRLYGSRRPPP